MYVEVGSGDGETRSFTSGLADVGWAGLAFEVVPESARACAARHASNTQVRVRVQLYTRVRCKYSARQQVLLLTLLHVKVHIFNMFIGPRDGGAPVRVHQDGTLADLPSNEEAGDVQCASGDNEEFDDDRQQKSPLLSAADNDEINSDRFKSQQQTPYQQQQSAGEEDSENGLAQPQQRQHFRATLITSLPTPPLPITPSAEAGYLRGQQRHTLPLPQSPIDSPFSPQSAQLQQQREHDVTELASPKWRRRRSQSSDAAAQTDDGPPVTGEPHAHDQKSLTSTIGAAGTSPSAQAGHTSVLGLVIHKTSRRLRAMTRSFSQTSRRLRNWACAGAAARSCNRTWRRLCEWACACARTGASDRPGIVNRVNGQRSVAVTSSVPVMTLDSALQLHGTHPGSIDLLVLPSGAGADLALSGCDLTVWRPRMVIVRRGMAALSPPTQSGGIRENRYRAQLMQRAHEKGGAVTKSTAAAAAAAAAGISSRGPPLRDSSDAATDASVVEHSMAELDDDDDDDEEEEEEEEDSSPATSESTASSSVALLTVDDVLWRAGYDILERDDNSGTTVWLRVDDVVVQGS